jgi:hypothetical protein
MNNIVLTRVANYVFFVRVHLATLLNFSKIVFCNISIHVVIYNTTKLDYEFRINILQLETILNVH